MKAEQKMTALQKESAMEFATTMMSKKDIGHQPAFVVDKNGKIVRSNPGAYCLGWFFSNYEAPYERENHPVLCQCVVTPDKCFQRGEETMHPKFTPEFITRWMNWATRSDLLSPYICEHTVEERKLYAPIALINTPRNAPLMVSTHIRYPWDRHNNHRNINVAIIRALRPKWRWSLVMAVACCFSSLEKGSVNVGTSNGGHDPFGHATHKMLALYAQSKFPHKAMDTTLFNVERPDRGSIEAMFSEHGHRERFNTVISEMLVKKGIKSSGRYGRYGGFIITQDDAFGILDDIATLLRAKQDEK